MSESVADLPPAGLGTHDLSVISDEALRWTTHSAKYRGGTVSPEKIPGSKYPHWQKERLYDSKSLKCIGANDKPRASVLSMYSEQPLGDSLKSTPTSGFGEGISPSHPNLMGSDGVRVQARHYCNENVTYGQVTWPLADVDVDVAFT